MPEAESIALVRAVLCGLVISDICHGGFMVDSKGTVRCDDLQNRAGMLQNGRG